MAKAARTYVFEGMELLPQALAPFVEHRLQAAFGEDWPQVVVQRIAGLRPGRDGKLNWDQAALFKTINFLWDDAFRTVWGRSERSWVNELHDIRNELAHGGKFSYSDAERALDTMRRLVEATGSSDIAASVAAELTRMRNTILRTMFAEQARNEERRKTQRFDIAMETAAGLLPWREVMAPHPDVASGEFEQAEFAANLFDVYRGRAPSEYGDPKDFFARTYLTEGLRSLLVRTAKRLAGQGGDPVMKLQVVFGGGKTHSLLALYHLAKAQDIAALPGVDQVLQEAGVDFPDNVRCAVLVGTGRSPSEIIKTEDGLEIRTSWGDMAWQLGGREGYEMVRQHDEEGLAPGTELLQELFARFSPALILIDEWVAYLRQLYEARPQPGGTFDSNLTFVQTLTEAVKAAPKTLLVATLPESDIEAGGEGGREALRRLEHTFARVESPWQPASLEESYEIVRRRLFQDVPGDKAHHKDNTIRQFSKLYKENSADFPQGVDSAEYRNKMQRAYPIHPALFDFLYNKWGTLENFQRTRGVLRLMAQVVHHLWLEGDKSVMIMPGSVPVGAERVEPELTRYLTDIWRSIIADDVDGPQSIARQIDRQNSNLGKVSATRRVARTIFLGTAAVSDAPNPGLTDKEIFLGVVQPGEKPFTFRDALHRLTSEARHLHSEQGRYWYSRKASLNRRAAEYARDYDEDTILEELDQRLRQYVQEQVKAERGVFDAVHPVPADSSDVPDEDSGVRLVVLGARYAHLNGKTKRRMEDSPAVQEAQRILHTRGQAPREYRNVLVFLAADAKEMDDLKRAMRFFKAWQRIVHETQALDLTQSEAARAKEKLAEAERTLFGRLQDTWKFLLYPVQKEPRSSEITWQHSRLGMTDRLLHRASEKLQKDSQVLVTLGPKTLQHSLDKIGIWQREKHIRLAELWEWCCKFIYMPRLKNRDVLTECVRQAVSGLLPGPFAYAERYNAQTKTYEGLLIAQAPGSSVAITPESVIVRADVAAQQQPEQLETKAGKEAAKSAAADTLFQSPQQTAEGTEPQTEKLPTHFYGVVQISPERPARDFARIQEGIIEPLLELMEANVSIRLEIDAKVPKGLRQEYIRILLENARDLKFETTDVE
jgi:hypothetical protein